MLDVEAQRRHRLRNTAQALLLLAGMVAMLAIAAWLVVGPGGVLWVALLGAATLVLRPRVPPGWVLSMYEATPLPPSVAPELHRAVRILAARADLPTVPQLYYIASPMMNALAVGRRDDAAIAVTDGLLRRLPPRELVGVLAHEISHVRADDLWIMTLSDTVGRLTHALAYTGVFLLVLTLPLTAGGTVWPLGLALVLTVFPLAVTLLQLALSRAREYDADLEAAALTGDPAGLAAALAILKRREGRLWERMMVPHRRAPDPLLLRTHPPTEERIRRLAELLSRDDRPVLRLAGPLAPIGYPEVRRPVRLRRPGIRW